MFWNGMVTCMWMWVVWYSVYFTYFWLVFLILFSLLKISKLEFKYKNVILYTLLWVWFNYFFYVDAIWWWCWGSAYNLNTFQWIKLINDKFSFIDVIIYIMILFLSLLLYSFIYNFRNSQIKEKLNKFLSLSLYIIEKLIFLFILYFAFVYKLIVIIVTIFK
jgi:hypothetical protein